MTSITHTCIAIAACLATSPAQNVVWEVSATPTVRPGGSSLARIEDHDGDGVDDFLTTVRKQRIQGTHVFWDSHIQLRSGRTGALLHSGATGLYSSVEVGGVSSAGDLDGDQSADYLFTRLGFLGNAVIAWSPSLDVELWRITLPHWFVFLPWMKGDLDGDGRRDLAIGMTDRLLVFDAFQAPLYQLTPPAGVEFWGLAPVGDLDGDQREDFALGLRQLQACALISGASGQVLTVLGSTATGEGSPYGSIGDIDGDGTGDFGVRYRDWPGGDYRTVIHSGASLQVLFTSNELIHAIRGDVDLDLDGIDDWLVIDNLPGNVVTPAFMRTRMLSARHEEVAWDLRDLGTGSARPIVVGRDGQSPYPLVVLSHPNRLQGIEATVSGGGAFGSDCRSDGLPPPRIAVHGIVEPVVGTRVTLAGAEPGALAVLVLDLPPVASPLPLGPLGFPGCVLEAPPDVLAVRIAGASGPGRGYASVIVPGPPAATAGLSSSQWLCLWPGAGGITEFATSTGHTLRAP